MKTALFIIFLTGCIFPQWVKVSQDSTIQGSSWEFNINQNKIYSAGYDLYISTNEGYDWDHVIQPGYFNGYVNDIDINENWIYVGTGGGFHFSSDNGNSWYRSGTFSENVRNLASHDNYIIASVFMSGQLFRSTDNGLNWVQLPPLPGDPFSIEDIYEYNNIFYVGTYEKGIYLTTDNGDSWIRITEGGVSGEGQTIRTFTRIGGTIFSGGVYIFKSTDNGYNWQKLICPFLFPFKLAANNNLIICTAWDMLTDSNKVYMSKDYGQNWISISEGLSDSVCSGLFLTDEYILAGLQFDGIWRRNLSELTSVKDEKIDFNNYNLSQNFPNPINPVTTIKYSIPVAQRVIIKVYDILGKEIATLVNEEKTPGSHEIKFDGSQLPSGVYIYNINSGDYSAAKKLVILK